MTHEERRAATDRIALAYTSAGVFQTHLDLLRHALLDNDAEGIRRTRECAHNALEMANDVMGEISAAIFAAYPCHGVPVSSTHPDGYLGATE